MISTINVTGVSGKAGYALFTFGLTAVTGPARTTCTAQWFKDEGQGQTTLNDWLNQVRYTPHLWTIHRQLVTITAGPRSEIVVNPYTSQPNTIMWS